MYEETSTSPFGRRLGCLGYLKNQVAKVEKLLLLLLSNCDCSPQLQLPIVKFTDCQLCALILTCKQLNSCSFCWALGLNAQIVLQEIFHLHGTNLKIGLGNHESVWSL